MRAVAAIVALLALGACGDRLEDLPDPAAAAAVATTTSTTVAETTTTTTEAVDPQAEADGAAAAVTGFFTAFGAADFDAAAALLENGEANKAKLAHCENLTAVFQGIAMKDVVVDGDRATLTYDILGANDAVLVEGSQGTAIKVDGEWIVAETTYLSLYDAASDSCTGPPPS